MSTTSPKSTPKRKPDSPRATPKKVKNDDEGKDEAYNVPSFDAAGSSGATLGWTLIHTSDVLKSVEFYTRVFGFDLIGKPSPYWAECDTGNTRLAFHMLDDKMKSDENKDKLEGYRSTGSHCFHVKCVDDFHKRMVKEKVKCLSEPSKSSHGDEKPERWMAVYKDNEGISFTTCEFRC